MSLLSLLSLCEELRRNPFEFLGAESALSLSGFFAGYSFANSSIHAPMKRAAAHFEGSDEMTACTLAYLTSANPKSSFDRLLNALECELKTHGEPPAIDVRVMPPLLGSILDSIENSRLGIFLMQPTIMCLSETLNGYWCGIDAFDSEDAQQQRFSMYRFELWLHSKYQPASAPWHAILSVYEGVSSFGLKGFHRLYNQFRQEAGPQ